MKTGIAIMAPKGFVAYYRVSTARQGASGLGIEAQRRAVAAYFGSADWQIVDSFVEVESGRRSDRPALAAALAAARLYRCPLVVAKVDRLTRSVAFLSVLLDAGVDVRFADLPAIGGPTGRFMVQQMCAVAELEAGLISARTRAALAAAKARGRRLGGDRGAIPSPEARERGRAALVRRAYERAADIAPAIGELQAAGISSLRGIATGLNIRGIPTPRGCGTWSPSQVMRLLKRIEAPRNKNP